MENGSNNPTAANKSYAFENAYIIAYMIKLDDI